MVFRNLIRQIETPDRLRGRMVGVNMVFFMGGPQLGELEAGLVANAMGPTVAVVTGGIGCLIATAWVAATNAGAARLSPHRGAGCRRRRRGVSADRDRARGSTGSGIGRMSSD